MPEMKPNQVELSHLLKAVDNELSAGRDKGDPTEQKLKVSLDDKDLWSKFKELTNEMIVTKSGRRMFPVMRISNQGLDPNAMYSFLLDFVPVDNHRWKYVNGDWVPGGKAEPSAPNAVYVHPDSPNFGGHWMKEPVSFSKVKLTNKMHGAGQIMLNSLHKYQPRVHIVKVGNGEKKTVATYTFPETQFVAVTAYQNEEITALKIKYNPFAKAFQDAKERPDHRDFSLDDMSDQKNLSHYNLAASTWFLPPGGHALVPPPAHAQFQSSLAAALPCTERFSLRDHRTNPYQHPFHRRSPPHGTYPHEVNPNSLSMLNLADNWTHHSMLANNTPAHQSQYMWNFSPTNQNCAMSQYSQYLRGSTGAYTLPHTPETTGINVTSSLSDSTSLGGYDSHTHGLVATSHSGSPQSIDTSAATAYSAASREAAKAALSAAAANSWNPLTSSSL